jgi:hypothetical protein
MADNPDLIRFLEVAQKRIENQHSVLWKVETHYTWLVYIIAGALVFLWLQQTSDFRSLAIPILSCLGLALSLVGYYVVRLEGEYLHEDHQIYNRVVADLPCLKKFHPEKGVVVKDWSQVKKDANKSFGLLLASVILNIILVIPVCILLCRRLTVRITDAVSKFRLSVRDAFQITLLLAALLFIFSIVHFLSLYN